MVEGLEIPMVRDAAFYGQGTPDAIGRSGCPGKLHAMAIK
jgi:hypothetical protein